MTDLHPPFFVQKQNIYAVPILHYNMETAAQILLAFETLKPDCVAVELPETMQLYFLHGASRLPDISLICAQTATKEALYYMCEPCDAAFEGLRCAIENGVRAFCIDLDVENYPDHHERCPDPYSIHKIGLETYYQIYNQSQHKHLLEKSSLDHQRELYMAKRLKELSFSYDRILFITGMFHLDGVLKLIDSSSFPQFAPASRESVQLCTLSEKSTREALAECGWITLNYEENRHEFLKAKRQTSQTSQTSQTGQTSHFPPDRQHLIYQLYKQASENYTKKTGNSFASYNMRNLMKFMRNYALVTDKLMPDLFQILSCARSCVDHNYAYETWELATAYPYRKNIDNLPELDLTVEEIWGHSKHIKFHLKQPSRKDRTFKKRPDKSKFKFYPPGSFGICSYPPEDISIEKFGDFLKKKGTLILTEEAGRTVPFVSSVQDGIDTRETIRHWFEKKLYVKIKGKPPGGASSVVIIFDEDASNEKSESEKYPWKLTWHGEHSQESDMAFYATTIGANVIGPGISRCEYGGFMLSSPPRRMLDIWTDPDYGDCRTKAEMMLVAAIDYAVQPLVVYVAPKPPRTIIKSFAARYGKKVIYIPLGQLSPILLNKIRVFHVLDSRDKRDIAGEYIY